MSEAKWYELADDEYFDSEGLSSSAVRSFATDGAWMFYHRYIKREGDRPYTKALREGHAFHLAMEHGTDWDSWVYIAPTDLRDPELMEMCREEWDQAGKNVPKHFGHGMEINSRSPIHQLYTKMHEEKYGDDRLPITITTAESVLRQVDAITENPLTREVIEAEEATDEHACYRECESTGLLIKCKPDRVIGDTIFDYKTTNVTLPWQFVNKAVGHNGRGGLGYHYQAEWYTRVTTLPEHKIVCVSKGDAPEAWLFEWPDHIMAQAKDTNTLQLQDIAQCILTQNWHTTGWGASLPLDPNERIPQ